MGKMEFVDWKFIHNNELKFNQEFNSKTPFRYLVIDNFLNPEIAEQLLLEFPQPDNIQWDATTYINQKKKFQKASFPQGSLFNDLFQELNSQHTTGFLTTLSNIQNLVSDPQLFGAGLHQSIRGAFLDVHVDFNIHPQTKFYRRLNLLIFLNKNWKKEYEGFLELWDLKNNRCMEKISPDFNRCVIFETNEISFHGHPAFLNTPDGVTRKSIATYFYTKETPAFAKNVNEHNSIFKNTEGMKGSSKNFLSGLIALRERILKRVQPH
jgi:Rps23 Pro-64 3,4-dihydroxylase Tpa1-like proline 4-hydroxylase